MSSGPALDAAVEPGAGRATGSRPFEDRLVDGVFDGGFDWVEVVRRHPLPCLAIAGVAGFLVGRAHGPELFEAASDALTERVTRTLVAADRY